jgi:hypothetical protein
VSRTIAPHAATPARTPRRGARRTARLALGLGAGLVAVLGLGAAGAPSAAATTTPVHTARGSRTVPAAPTGLPAGIEDPAAYVRQLSCDPAAKPGTLALGRLLTATYPGTSYVVGHDCGSESIASEHVDGRALDWIVSARSAAQKAQAQAFLDWLFASDTAGRAFANARRLGVMYIIWNDRIWGAWSALDGWGPYSTCSSHPETAADSVCHRNRLHVSLSWEGATARTSFWSKAVSAPDYGPCRAKDLNWAPRWTAPNRKPCTEYPAVKAPAGASAVLTALVAYSGATLGAGDDGPAVAAVQRALGVPADGAYGSFTADAVSAFQARRGLPRTGAMDAATWRALLAAHAMTAPVAQTPAPAASPLARYAGTVLRYNDRGPAVLALQKALKVTASGWFGPKTRTAVVAFQVRAKLPATGVVDARTWKALGA